MATYLKELILGAAQMDAIKVPSSASNAIEQGCADLAALRIDKALDGVNTELALHQAGQDERIPLLVLKGEILLYAEQYLLSVTCFYEALKQLDELSGKELRAYIYQGLSAASRFTEDYEKSLDYIELGMELHPSILSTRVKLSMSKGICLARTKQADSAFAELHNCVSLARETDSSYLLASALKSLADLYMTEGNSAPAKKCYDEAQSLAEQLEHYVLLTMVHNRRGQIFERENAQQDALLDYEKALKLSQKHGFFSGEQICHRLLADFHAKMGDYEQAYQHIQQSAELERRLREQKASSSHQRIEMEYVMQMKDAEIHLLQEVAEKHKELHDSLLYAQNIQQAILPDHENMRSVLGEHFILYEPRDIVGGDFYWFHSEGDSTWIAAADCTGHGVPGALVSMLCANSLNQVVKERGIRSPDQILQAVNAEVAAVFSGGAHGKEVKDGMDIALCLIDAGSGKMTCAGANNPVVVISQGELRELKGDRRCIGVDAHRSGEFCCHEVDLHPGDWVYLYSDGFQDQFGGKKGKKFMAKNFKRLLASLSHQKADEQLQQLKQTLAEWEGDHERTDDVLVLGVRTS